MTEFTTVEQSQARLDICKQCSEFSIGEDCVTRCNSANLDINLLISEVAQLCPLEKW